MPEINYIEKVREFVSKREGKHLAYVHTYGCQQNFSDGEKLEGLLEQMGYTITDSSEGAEFVIFNTCAIRENAEKRVFGNVGILKKAHEENPDMIIAVCGCMVQQEHICEKIKKVHNHVDLIFGTHALYRMPELLYKTIKDNKTVVDITDSEGAISEDIPILRDKEEKAWVSVMYGCNNFCTYCIVPYVRGRERSRKSEDIINEVKELVKNGTTEISLLGQNVNSYGKDLDIEVDFADLLKMINDIEGVKRIRFMTSHPKDISDKLIYTMRDCDKICKQLHLPLQSGSDKVLKEMNRHYTKKEYLTIVDKVKKEIPNITLTTDIIVGFPTETTEDFKETLEVLKYVRYDNIFSFIYSKI